MDLNTNAHSLTDMFNVDKWYMTSSSLRERKKKMGSQRKLMLVSAAVCAACDTDLSEVTHWVTLNPVN